MTVFLYIMVEIFSVIFLIFAGKFKKNHNKNISILFGILSFLVLCSLVCLRDISVGIDTVSYANAYLRIANGLYTDNDVRWLGYGFIFFAKFISFIFENNYQCFFALIGFLTIFLVYKRIFENSKCLWMSIFLLISFGLYFQMFNQARQMLAIAIVFYAVKYIQERKLKKYIIFILLATCIHNSAIVMLPFYYIANFEINRKNNFVYIIIAIISFILFSIIETLLGHFYYWQAYSETNFNQENSITAILNFGVRFLMLFICMIFSKKVILENDKSKCLYNMVIWCTILQFLTLKSYLFARLTTYFFVFFLLLIPEVVNCIFKKKDDKLLIELVIIILFSIYEIIYFTKGTGAIGYGYNVYNFFWN